MNPEEVDAVEENIDQQEWCAHPHTKLLLSRADLKAKEALEGLVNACGASTDLRIVQKYAQYRYQKDLAIVLRRGRQEKE